MANYCTHCFSVELAAQIGLREAIILQHLFWWHEHNEPIPAMNIDGRVWFFLSAGQISQVFPYLSEKTVRTVLEKLIAEGYLIKDHKGQGQERFNRTNWYALTNYSLGLFHFPIWENGNNQTGKSIVNNIDIKKDNNKNNSKVEDFIQPQKFDFRKALIAAGVESEVADTWLQIRKARKAVNSEIAWRGIEGEIAKSGRSANDCIRYAVEQSWRGFKASWLVDEKTRKPDHSRATAVDRLLAMGQELYGPVNNTYDEQ